MCSARTNCQAQTGGRLHGELRLNSWRHHERKCLDDFGKTLRCRRESLDLTDQRYERLTGSQFGFLQHRWGLGGALLDRCAR